MSLSKIAEAEKNLSKPQDVREEMALVMAPYANWEQFLVPAPLTITILGQLMLISTQKDFSLANRAPKDGFVHLRYPDSFRACLVQVSNKGWEAFKLAHKNMDQIRLFSANVPGNLKNAVQVLFQGDEQDIADELPIELGQIKDTADKCVKLAKNVEQVFDSVMYMVSELLEACVNAESDYEDKRRTGLVELEILQVYKKSAEEERKEAEERKKDFKDALKEAEENFKEASNDIPSGWGIIGMNFVEGLAKSVTTLTNITSICSIFKPSVIGDAVSDVITSAKSTFSSEKKIDAQIQKAFAKTHEVETQVQTLKAWYLTDDGELDTKKLVGSADIMATQVSTRLGVIQASVTKIKDNEVKLNILTFCEEGRAICSALESIKKDIEIESSMASQIAKRISNLYSEATAMALQADILLSSNATDKLPPNLEQASASHDSDVPTSKIAVENARYKAESAKGILKSRQEAYDASCDSLRENTQKLNEFMADISKIDLKNIEFDEIKKTLKQGILALAKLKEQWQNLVEFFSMMSNLIECTMSVSLQGFLDKAGKASERYEIAGYTLSDYRKDSIYKQAFNAAKIAYLVNMISKSYVEVSNKHLMHRIAGLAKLLAFDPETEQHAIQQAMYTLTSGCTEAQQEIESLVLKNKAEFDGSIKRRMHRIESEMKAVLPPPSKADAKLLEEAKQKCDVEVKKKVAVKSAAPDLEDFV